MTKTELEKEVKRLKELVRELQKENKVAEQAVSSDGGADSVAYGITLVGEKKDLALVKIFFDLNKNCAIIDKESVVLDRIGPLAGKAKTAIVDEIIRRDKERG